MWISSATRREGYTRVPGNETAAEEMIAAVAYIIRRHREIPKAELAKVLEPLTNVIRYRDQQVVASPRPKGSGVFFCPAINH